MITSANLQARVKAVPFVPFRVITSDGSRYDVTHPEFVIVFRRFLEIGIFGPDDPNFPEYAQRVSILHITALNDLPQPAAPTAPGAAA